MRSLRSKLLIGIASFTCFACSGGPAGPDPLPPTTPTSSICGAAKETEGARIRTAGNFHGFGYEANSRLVTLKSEEACNDKGAGTVYAMLANNDERERLNSAQPGTRLVVEGTVDHIEQGRFVYISEAIVAAK